MNSTIQDTLNHIAQVAQHLNHCAVNLLDRATFHDASKLKEPELSGYAGLADALKGLEYGTPEYRAAFAPFKEIIKHHYEHNSHHPEHYQNGVEGMSLFDVVEMLCDWKAASERGGSDFNQSMHVSTQRFGIDHQLQRILLNTAIELGWVDRP